ncbi:ComEC/Rec2 family competence protein [Falsihalocynthiibacter sp. SS001]|uniref:ComEC/Rec2 family competence protein n=1 Tax=Falsihalocynthiibacter sp. SS001 TaxID=3349698 RepID=UPI0036D2C8A3
MWNSDKLQALSLVVARQRGHLFPWVPVFLAVGIGIYFSLKFEPNWLVYSVLVVIAAVSLILVRFSRESFAPFLLALALICGGVLIAGLRSHLVSAPVITFRYYGPIQGRIVKVDRSVSEAVRLTLDQVVLDNFAPDRTPENVRISLHGEQGFITPEVGMTVILSGHLSPPSGPVEPGGFNFRKMAWFQGLGAVGYTRSPVLTLYPAEQGRAGLFITRLRRDISQAVQQQIPGEEGAFAAAILTGDRSDMSHATLQSLRNSNLAHLLAISGLHMGMLTGFVFTAARFLFSFFPSIAMRIPTKKLAAVVAMLFGAGYLALSGGSVATIRAFIMVSVMFLAILRDQRALTLRAVAIAALIILLIQPESLTGPGFQMSFAATSALVAVFGAMREIPNLPLAKYRPVRVIFAVITSSFVAGMATAPVAAVHFNQIAQYGLLANVITVPLMGVMVMPAAVVAALLVPFGLEAIALEVMRWGVWWILAVARQISQLEGAIRLVVTPDPIVLPLIAIGGVMLIIWQARGRMLGVPLILASFLLWNQTERPEILISDSGTLIGVMTEKGRALNKSRGGGFVADSWLENDGDMATQEDAFARGGFEVSKGLTRVVHQDTSIIIVSGKTILSHLPEYCETADILIVTVEHEPPRGCSTIDMRALRQSGSMAVTPTNKGPVITTAREREGERIWLGAGR